MNLLRPITIDSAGNERMNDVFFHHYKLPSVTHQVKPYPVTFLCLPGQLFHSLAPTAIPDLTRRTFLFPATDLVSLVPNDHWFETVWSKFTQT